MRLEAADTTEVIRVASEALGNGGLAELARRVGYRWTPRQISGLLNEQEADVRKLACLVLAMCGNDRVTGGLIRTLRDEDPQIAELAEQALWAIWFRSGNGPATRHFRQGLEALKADEHHSAVRHFHKAQQADTNFAEAHNQCAVAHYLAGEWSESIEQTELTLRLNPSHFGALAGMGHGHFQLGNFSEASRCYRRALALNPRMHDVATALGRIEQCLVAV